MSIHEIDKDVKNEQWRKIIGAPEMKNKEPYNQSVDWFSLGKLIIDCQGRNAYAEGAQFWETSGLLDLVDGLLIKDPAKRLGAFDSLCSLVRTPFELPPPLPPSHVAVGSPRLLCCSY